MDAEEINSSDSDATVSYDAENSTPPSGDIENQPPDEGDNDVEMERHNSRTPEPIEQVVEVPLQAVIDQVVLGSQNSISTISTQDDIIKPPSSKKRKRWLTNIIVKYFVHFNELVKFFS